MNSKQTPILSPGKLPVMEHFYTIQGEGFNSGTPCYFIRLAGCDVGCVWCDVKESWHADAHPYLPIDEIVDLVKKSGAPYAVITGGEPLMYDCGELCAALHKEGIQTFIETSGAHPLTGEWDWICLSPKKFKAPLPEIFKKADELKIIIFHKSDFKWAEEFVPLLKPKTRLYLQPEWSKSDNVLPMIIDYIKENPKWKLSLQTHKFIHIP